MYIYIAKAKLNIDTDEEVVVLLMDGTEIDSESFLFMEKETMFIIALKDEAVSRLFCMHNFFYSFVIFIYLFQITTGTV